MTNTIQIFLAMFKYIFFILNPIKGVVFIVLLFLFVMSVASYFFDPNNIDLFKYIAIVSIIVSFIQLFQELFNYDDLEVRHNESLINSFVDILPSSEEQKDGFLTISNPNIENSTILFSTIFNEFIIQKENDFHLIISESNKKVFYHSIKNQNKPLSTIIQWKCFSSIKQEQVFNNENKVALCSPIRTNVKDIKIFKVDYYSSYLTNEISATKIVSKIRGKGYVGFDPSITFPQDNIFGERRIKEFGEYLYGNHLGTSTLAISSNKYLCIWRQNVKAQQSSNLLVPTGSGSTDWKDLKNTASLKNLVVKTINRELYEESLKRGSNLKPKDVEETILIGYFRRFIRGGKSEFLGISRLSVPHISLAPNEEEVEDTTGLGDQMYYPVKTFTDLEKTVTSLLESAHYQQKISTSLWASLLALNDAIKKNPLIIKRFFRYS
ncbi:hypothetical protein [Spirosoma montaniterrae]|uniref:Nudix hydrolase domain-containing protein n=1 Tax=Spirosoma montaniterrae TaxID=1178516 RepID=A0A1P9WXV3_9BACT|nr:hypothetical protein [Spirosoma montaniterrae]AQG80222.1 hypothetical protein AWR27_13380 [Spirosoma montaniterrae]